MSAENVEVVQRIYDAVARRDTETPFELYAEDIVWDVTGEARGRLSGTPIAQGHEGVRRAWADALASFGAIDFEVEELIDLGDQVLAVIHDRLVGRTSGAPVRNTHYAVWTLAGGKVARLQVFDDREQAERAARMME